MLNHINKMKMKKQLLTVAASLLMSGAAFAQFTAAQIWSLNLRTNPMPHNTINFSYFDMAVTYSSTGIPLTGMSSSQPGLPLPKFRITSTVSGNSTVCISSEQEDTDPWTDTERATFMSNGTIDTSVTIEQSNNGENFQFDSKVVRVEGQNANEYEFVGYNWLSDDWTIESRTKFFLNNGLIDSAAQLKFTSPTTSVFAGYTKFYYSNGLDSVLDFGFDTVTNEFVVEDKVIIESKENGKTKSFGLYSVDNGTWNKIATFTYKNGNTSSINNSLTNNKLSIYPNPANETLQINVPNNMEVKNAHILNANGQIVKEINNLDKVDVSNLPAGLYLIQATTNSYIITQKFIKN